jgi:hypothetical protein
MLYGCIPLGLDVGGIPTAIGKNGLIMNDWDENAAIDFIQKNHNRLNREIFKNQIEEKFELNLRKEKLLNEIKV